MKYICLIVFTAWSLNVFSQSRKEPGYVVTNSGDTLRGIIEFPEKNKTPRQLTFKPSGTNAKSLFSPNEIRCFALENGDRYISKSLWLDVTPLGSEHDAYYSDTTILLQDTIFAQTLVDGHVSLYEHVDGNKRHYFVSSDTAFKELYFHQYLIRPVVGQPQLYPERKYIGQLIYYLRQCPSLRMQIEETQYARSSFQKLFSEYYKCTELKPVYEAPLMRIRFLIAMFGGASLTQVAFNGTGGNNIQEADFSTSLKPSLGIRVDGFSSYWQNFFISNELMVQSYHTTGSFVDTISEHYHSLNLFELDFVYIRWNLLVKYYFINGKVRPYMNAGISNSFATRTFNTHERIDDISGSIYTSTQEPLTYIRNHEFGFLASAGLQYWKLNMEVRYEFANGMSNSNTLKSSVQRAYFLLGYQF